MAPAMAPPPRGCCSAPAVHGEGGGPFPSRQGWALRCVALRCAAGSGEWWITWVERSCRVLNQGVMACGEPGCADSEGREAPPGGGCIPRSPPAASLRRHRWRIQTAGQGLQSSACRFSGFSLSACTQAKRDRPAHLLRCCCALNGRLLPSSTTRSRTARAGPLRPPA